MSQRTPIIRASPSSTSSRRSSIKYDLRKRVLVTNLNKTFQSKSDVTATSTVIREIQQRPLPTKPHNNGSTTGSPHVAPLDLINDIRPAPSQHSPSKSPSSLSSRCHLVLTPSKQKCVLPHQTVGGSSDQKQQSQRPMDVRKFRINPEILTRNPIVHTPVKAQLPTKRRYSEPMRDTMSIHLLRDDYVPPRKVQKSDHDEKMNNNDEKMNNHDVNDVGCSPLEDYRQPHVTSVVRERPIPLPRRSKMKSSTAVKTDYRSTSAASSSSTVSSNSDAMYACIKDCTTGTKYDIQKHKQSPGEIFRKDNQNFVRRHRSLSERADVSENIYENIRSKAEILELLASGSSMRRRASPLGNLSSRFRSRSSSSGERECRARKSLMFSSGITNSKTEPGMTLKNIYAHKMYGSPENDTPLTSTIDRISSPPDEPPLPPKAPLCRPSPSTTPRPTFHTGIYANNTMVIDTASKLKKDEVDASYGFACRMRPMLRVFNSRRSLLPSKPTPKKVVGQLSATPVKKDDLPRVVVRLSGTDENQVTTRQTAVHNKPSTPAKSKPTESVTICNSKEIAVQTSFIVHDEIECTQKKKRKSIDSIMASMSAKVKRRSSILRDRIRKSLDSNSVPK